METVNRGGKTVSLQQGNYLLKSQMHIKCMQLNLQHSRSATNNLTHIILHDKIDVAFLHEPYTIRNNVAGFPKYLHVETEGKELP
jgi:hypothetical protein